MCKDPTPIEYFWLMQMLGNFGAKQNFIFSASSLSKNHFCKTEGADIYRRCTQIQHLKKKKKYCSQHHVLHYECFIARQTFQLILFTCPFQSSVIVRRCFEARI